MNAESPDGIVRDKAAHAKWFDTQWRLQRAIDTKRDLGELPEFGITPKGDGSYSVDIANFPQWTPLQESLTRLLVRELLAMYEADLTERGFRDQDIDAMKAYVEANQPRPAMLAETGWAGWPSPSTQSCSFKYVGRAKEGVFTIGSFGSNITYGGGDKSAGDTRIFRMFKPEPGTGSGTCRQ